MCSVASPNEANSKYVTTTPQPQITQLKRQYTCHRVSDQKVRSTRCARVTYDDVTHSQLINQLNIEKIVH